MSTLQFDTWKNSTGTAEFYKCRAWVNFNGTGTVAIRASGNVSSITDNGTGDYTINFTTAMPDASYCAAGMYHFNEASSDGTGNGAVSVSRVGTGRLPASLRVSTRGNDGAGTALDCLAVMVAIFR